MADKPTSDEDYIRLTWERFEAQKEALEKTANILKLLGEEVPPAMGFLYPQQPKFTLTTPEKTMSELVREAVQSVNGVFNRTDIVNIIQMSHPQREVKPLSVGSYLSAMVGNKIEVVKPSEDGKQAVYRRKSSISE